MKSIALICLLSPIIATAKSEPSRYRTHYSVPSSVQVPPYHWVGQLSGNRYRIYPESWSGNPYVEPVDPEDRDESRSNPATIAAAVTMSALAAAGVSVAGLRAIMPHLPTETAVAIIRCLHRLQGRKQTVYLSPPPPPVYIPEKVQCTLTEGTVYPQLPNTKYSPVELAEYGCDFEPPF